MSDYDSILEAKARDKARLREQMEAIDREMAEIEQAKQIAAKYGLKLTRGEERSNWEAPEAAPPHPKANVFIAHPAVAAPLTICVGGQGNAPETVGGLVEDYENNPSSPLGGKRYNGRVLALRLCRALKLDAGEWRIDQIDENKILKIYEEWVTRGAAQRSGSDGVSIAHAKINQLRSVVLYGARTYNDPKCIHLSYVLRRLRFKPPKVRETEGVSAAENEAFIAKARAMGMISMALAQAFQFDAKLSQKDVIGEWIPASEPEHSEIYTLDKKQKWIHGICWPEIGKDLKLRHRASRDGQEIVVDLRHCPNIMGVLNSMPSRPTEGPIVIFEQYGLPYSASNFRVIWRRLARQVGIKEGVKNRDTRFSEDEESSPKHANGKAGEFLIPRGAH